MSIISLTFVFFVFSVILIYWISPKRLQWWILLIASAIFYLAGGIKSSIYVVITSSTIYFSTIWMQSIEDKYKLWLSKNHSALDKDKLLKHKSKIKRNKKIIMNVTLLVNIGILCSFKYLHFVLAQFNAVASLFGTAAIQDDFNFIIPLGISFYTFQSIGYLLDIYWEHYEVEKNYFKVLLFTSFFPQITQGPISSFDSLSNELFSEHKFSYKKYVYGMQRMLWGFAKKLLIANVMGSYVSNLFANYQSYTGITTLLGAFCYSVQIYADFSGYMDIMCGFCEAIGIRLRENFDRPYFSKSIAEYWRRWHISLGDWFKKYIYYPIGMSSWSRNLAKKLKVSFGVHFANTLPATIALLIVWTATGLWHGANWGYVVWGLLNGVFIIFSMWMEPIYKKIKCWIHINDNSCGYQCFQIIRTFVLVTLIKVLPEVGGLKSGLALWKHIFTDHRIPQSIDQLFEFVNAKAIWFVIATIGTLMMFVVSLLQGRKMVRDYFNMLPIPIRIMTEAVCVVIVVLLGGLAMDSFGIGGFMYAGY